MTWLVLLLTAFLVMWLADKNPTFGGKTIYSLAEWRWVGRTFTLQFATRQFSFGVSYEWEQTIFVQLGCFVLCIQWDRTDRNSYQASIERTLAAGMA